MSRRLYHVGRLDGETEGLIFLTNDGEFAQTVSHPSYEIKKTYLVETQAPLPRGAKKKMLEGIELEDGVASVDSFTLVDSAPGKALLEIVLHSGKNRIVRRLCKAVGIPVHRLVRVKIGPVNLGALKPGTMIPLTGKEVNQLMSGDKPHARKKISRRKPNSTQRAGRKAAFSITKSGAKKFGAGSRKQGPRKNSR
jgi:pseudouridine synthase